MQARLIQSGAYLALLWAVYLLGVSNIAGSIGIYPRDPTSPITDILAAALLHSADYHIVGNTIGLIPLLIGLSIVDDKPLLTIVLLAIAAGGTLWILGDPARGPHIGASDVITALTGFLVVYGLRSQAVIPVLIAVAVLFYRGIDTYLMSMPDAQGSWEGHFYGLVVGIIWGFLKPKPSVSS